MEGMAVLRVEIVHLLCCRLHASSLEDAANSEEGEMEMEEAMKDREQLEQAKQELTKMKFRNTQSRKDIEDEFSNLEQQLERLKHFKTSQEAKVKEWLTDIVGLPQYFRILISAGFDDLDAMKELSLTDLAELNILKLGHKKKLIKAAKELKGDTEDGSSPELKGKKTVRFAKGKEKSTKTKNGSKLDVSGDPNDPKRPRKMTWNLL